MNLIGQGGVYMVKVSFDLHIKCSAHEVFTFISNMENNPLWQQGMASCKIIGNTPLRVGQEYLQQAKFLGRQIDSHFKVIEYEENYLIKATTLESSFPITFTRIVTGDENNCRVQVYVEGDSSKFYKILEPMVQRMVYKSIHRDYYRLKDIMEFKS